MGLVTNDRKSKKLIINFNIHLELQVEALIHEHDLNISPQILNNFNNIYITYF